MQEDGSGFPLKCPAIPASETPFRFHPQRLKGLGGSGRQRSSKDESEGNLFNAGA